MLSAAASDSDGTIARVDFYDGGNLLGTVTTAPYALSWSNVGAGTHTLAAAATDNSGASTTSAPVTVTVANPPNSPPAVAITAPANGTTMTAPASTTITASASDSDGGIAKVDFYAAGTFVGTASAYPYSVGWNNVAAGSYSLTAVATDNAGARTTSAALTVTVQDPPSTGQLPSGWSEAGIGGEPFPGSARASSGTFTVTGSGVDIWGTADQFHYAYRTLTGDGTIVARVTSIQYVSPWVKAGVMIRGRSPQGRHTRSCGLSGEGVAFQRRPPPGNERGHGGHDEHGARW